MNRRNSDDNRDININDDYLELLNRTDDFEDVYSGKSDDYEDISSSSGDIYIGGGRRETVSHNDVYFNNARKASQQPDGQHTRVYRSSEVNQGYGAPATYNQPGYSQPNCNQTDNSRQVYDQQRYNAPQYNQPVNAPQMSRKAHKFDTQNLGDEISDHEARKRKKSKKGLKIFIAVVAVFLTFSVGVFSYLSSVVNGIVGKFNEAEEIEHIDDLDSLAKDDNVHNILLIGADADKGGSSRSDSIIILSVNKNTGRITVCSILRDTHVDIPGESEAKINSAYSWGGANLLVQTIEQNFGIYIDDYASVDFEMFVELVDALGGIDVDVTEEEANYINNVHGYGKEEKPDEVPSGDDVHLDGYQALWYSRIRKLGNGDWDRTERQRKVIEAIVEEIKNKIEKGDIGAVIEIFKEIAPYITTTLSTSDLWKLAFSLGSCFVKSDGRMDDLFVPQQIPFDDTWEYTTEWDGSSITPDLEENKELLYKLLYEDYDPDDLKDKDKE